MDVSTPQGAGAAPGLVYTTVQRAVQLLEVSTLQGAELSLDLSTLQWLVLVLGNIREIGSSIPRNIYF
jgi:hypothetical protein